MSNYNTSLRRDAIGTTRQMGTGSGLFWSVVLGITFLGWLVPVIAHHWARILDYCAGGGLFIILISLASILGKPPHERPPVPKWNGQPLQPDLRESDEFTGKWI